MLSNIDILYIIRPQVKSQNPDLSIVFPDCHTYEIWQLQTVNSLKTIQGTGQTWRRQQMQRVDWMTGYRLEGRQQQASAMCMKPKPLCKACKCLTSHRQSFFMVIHCTCIIDGVTQGRTTTTQGPFTYYVIKRLGFFNPPSLFGVFSSLKALFSTPPPVQ